MRFLVTFGALAVAAGLFAACGDDDGGDGNTAGTGGTGGAAGNAGNAGRGGTAGNAGTAGNGNGGTAGNGNGGDAGNGNGGTAGNGNAGTAGTAGTSGGGDEPDAGDAGLSDAGGNGDAGDAGPPPCTGCLELRAAVTEAGGTQTAFFQLVFDATDMSGVTVTFHVATLPGEENVNVTAFATDGDFAPFGAGEAVLLSGEDGFADITVDISALTADDAAFDDTNVIAIGLQLDSFTTITGDSLTVTALLDSVTFDNDGDEFTDLTFTDDAEGFALNAFAGSQDAEIIHH